MVRAALLALVLAWAGACDREVAGGKADGAAVFSEVCARCHGPQGVPDTGMVARLGVVPLTSKRVQDLSDADIRRQILEGSANQQMPSFAGALSGEQIDAVIRHVRGLSRK